MPKIGLSIFFLLVAMSSIQIGVSFAKRLFPLIGPELATVLRIAMAALMLATVWRPWREPLNRSKLTSILFYGAALGGMNLLFYLAVERIPLGITVALEFTGPLGVAIFASRRAVDFVWAALAALGIVLVLPIDAGEHVLDPIGILLALAAGGAWAAYIVAGRKLSHLLHEGRAASLGMIAAAMFVVPTGLTLSSNSISVIDGRILVIMLAVAILSSALPYSLEMIALKRVPPRTFGILMSLEPAFAALSGWLFLSEQLTAVQWGAIGSIIAASAGSSIGAARPIESVLESSSLST